METGCVCLVKLVEATHTDAAKINGNLKLLPIFAIAQTQLSICINFRNSIKTPPSSTPHPHKPLNPLFRYSHSLLTILPHKLQIPIPTGPYIHQLQILHHLAQRLLPGLNKAIVIRRVIGEVAAVKDGVAYETGPRVVFTGVGRRMEKKLTPGRCVCSSACGHRG